MKDVAISLEIDVEVNESHATCLVPATQDTYFMKHIIHAHKLTVSFLFFFFFFFFFFFLIQWHTLPKKVVLLVLVLVQNLISSRGLTLKLLN